jgi:hypothetical protein
MPCRDSFAIGLLTVIWVAMVVLVDPVGDFPLNDDWAYGWSVKYLLDEGNLQLSDWTAVNLLTQTLWGALFCLPFGFSFTALRLSTLTLGLIGAIATYGTLREVNASPRLSLLGALTLIVNPIYLGLAHSFMTDVPSFAFTIVSFYFFTRALQRQSSVALVLGTFVCFVSILNRQTGVLTLPAFAGAYLVTHGLHRRTLLPALSPSLLGLVLYFGYPAWLKMTERAPHLYDFQATLMWRSLSGGLLDLGVTYLHNLLVMSMYLGLFLLPFAIVAASDLLRLETIRPRAKSLAALLVVAAVAAWAAKYARMPLIGNVLETVGIGPSPIARSLVGFHLDAHTVHRAWQIATVAAVVGALLLLRMLVAATRAALKARTSLDVGAPALFAVLMAVLYVLPIAALRPGNWFDRYLIALLAPLIALGVMRVSARPAPHRALPAVAAILIAVYGAFAVAAVHDYLSWNRTRWQALNALMQESRIPAERVDGGFEFNGWFFGNRLPLCNPEFRNRVDVSDRSWGDFTCVWSPAHTAYIASPAPGDGYVIERSHTFTRWLPPGEQKLYVLRRNTPGG